MKKIKGFLSYKKSGLKHPDKADLNKDKKITGYEKARGKAVQGAVKEAYAGAETELNKSLEYAKFYLEKSVETIDELDAIELENIKSRLEVIVDNFNSVYDDYFDLQENVFSLEDDLEEVTEKWKGDVKEAYAGAESKYKVDDWVYRGTSKYPYIKIIKIIPTGYNPLFNVKSYDFDGNESERQTMIEDIDRLMTSEEIENIEFKLTTKKYNL